MPKEEVPLEMEEVLGHLFLGRHVGHPRKRQHLVGAPRLEQGLRQDERVGRDDIIVGEAVDEHQRSCEVRRIAQQAAALVVFRMFVGVTDIALGVMRVVQAPVCDGGASDRRVNSVGSAHDRKRSEIPAERPAANAHTGQIELGAIFGQGMQCVDLVIEDLRGEIAPDLTLERRAAVRRASTVGDDNSEARHMGRAARARASHRALRADKAQY